MAIRRKRPSTDEYARVPQRTCRRSGLDETTSLFPNLRVSHAGTGLGVAAASVTTGPRSSKPRQSVYSSVKSRVRWRIVK